MSSCQSAGVVYLCDPQSHQLTILISVGVDPNFLTSVASQIDDCGERTIWTDVHKEQTNSSPGQTVGRGGGQMGDELVVFLVSETWKLELLPLASLHLDQERCGPGAHSVSPPEIGSGGH